MTLGKLMSPLNLDLDELELELEWLPLYGEFAERFNEALDLVATGVEMWRPHEREEWAIEAAAEISRSLYTIEQRTEWGFVASLSLDVPSTARLVASSDSRITDSQLAAALAMAYGCRAINVLREWQAQLADDMFEASGRALIEDTRINYPEAYATIVNDYRIKDSIAEIEARESAADLLGRARNSIVIAELYRDSSIPPAALKRISERALKTSRAAVGRKAGERSGAARQERNAERDRAICDAGRKLLVSGRAPSEISGIISRMEVSGSLGSKGVRDVLRKGLVLDPA